MSETSALGLSGTGTARLVPPANEEGSAGLVAPPKDASGSLGPPDEEAVAPPAKARALARRLFWAAALALACAAALAAAGVFSGPAKPASLYQRTMAIAGEYRCPVCAGESAAASNAPAAVEIRQLITRWLSQGESPAQIRSKLVADYGPSILEKPPASGLDALVWVLPVLAAACGAGGLALAFARWRKRPAGPVAQPGPGVSAQVDAPLAPIGAQGSLFGPAPATYASQERTPGAGGASSTAPLPTGETAPSRRPLQALWRRAALPVGVTLVVVAVALLVVDHFSAPQLPGGTITGSITGLNSELEEAQALTARDPAGALALYQQVLKTYPDQPIALAAEGWIFAEAGLGPEALSQLTKAEHTDPSYGLAHLYRGLVLLEELKRPKAAAAELEWYLSHDPAPGYVKSARQALAEARSDESRKSAAKA